MNDLPRAISALTLFVADHQRSRDFYRSLFGEDPVYEDAEAATFRLDNLMLNLLVARSAPELIEPASVGAAGGGVRQLMTISVTDVDAAVARLAELGVPLLNGPIDRPWGVRTAAFADPDGYAWELAQPV